MALSFDGTHPQFAPNAKKQSIPDTGLTVYYGDQCPYIPQRVEKLREYCAAEGIECRFIQVRVAITGEVTAVCV